MLIFEFDKLSKTDKRAFVLAASEAVELGGICCLEKLFVRYYATLSDDDVLDPIEYMFQQMSYFKEWLSEDCVGDDDKLPTFWADVDLFLEGVNDGS